MKNQYGIKVIEAISNQKYKAIILAVAHNEFIELDLNTLKDKDAIVFDTKGVLDLNEIDGRL